jgi:hypothetical protein
MDENVNTMQASKVCSNDDDDNNANNDPTAFDLSSNSNDITDTSAVATGQLSVAQHQRPR